MNELTLSAIQVAMNGLAERGRAIAANVANVETPGYLAKRVDFESSLRSAIADGDPATAGITTSISPEATNTQGNNVVLEDETVLGLKNGQQYQLAISAANAEFKLMRTAIGV